MDANRQRIDEHLDEIERQQVEAIKAEFEEFWQRVDRYSAWLDGIMAEHEQLMQRMEAKTS